MGKRIAITGGIGCGKSTVINIIKEKGYSVFSCDEIYKEIVQDREYIAEIERCFPNAIENGNINRRALANIVFSNEKARKTLDNLSHPKIMARLLKQMSESENKLVFAEVPLLFEGEYENLFDGVIVVMRDKNERLHAVMERDRASETDVLARIASQFDYDKLPSKNLKSCYFINNDGDLAKLKTDVENCLISIEK